MKDRGSYERGLMEVQSLRRRLEELEKVNEELREKFYEFCERFEPAKPKNWTYEGTLPHLFTEADRRRDGKRYVCLKVIELMDSFNDNRPGVAEAQQFFREIAQIEMGE